MEGLKESIMDTLLLHLCPTVVEHKELVVELMTDNYPLRISCLSTFLFIVCEQ